MRKSMKGYFSSELQNLILQCIRTAWGKSKTWVDIQGCLADELRSHFGAVNVNENVPLKMLGVLGVKAEIDIVVSAYLTHKGKRNPSTIDAVPANLTPQEMTLIGKPEKEVLHIPEIPILIHVSGHNQPRHEKELLEFIAVSLSDPRFRLAVLVVCSDNTLRLEGKVNSFSYCTGPLERLIKPVLKHSNLQGLLIVGLTTPPPSSGMKMVFKLVTL